MKKQNNSSVAEFNNIITLIEKARSNAFHKVNEELVLLYFQVGNIVSIKVKEGSWGDNTVNELATYIFEKTLGFSGFSRRGLYRMMQFSEAYSSTSECFLLWVNSKNQNVSPVASQIDQTSLSKKMSPKATLLQDIKKQHEEFIDKLIIQITWTNHLEIFSAAKKPEERLFYMIMCITEKLSKLELRRHIKTAFFERTMLSNKKVSTPMTLMSQNLFKDPYIFEFLDLPDSHSEKDLEKAIVNNLQKFILEIGKGFTYMGNQFRLQVGNKDYHTDLLFYNRELQCLVMFELKIEEFEPEFMGKLNFYLEALDRDVKRPHENPSIGVLLCKGKDSQVVEYAMARNTSPALIADYETKLIPKNILENKLQQLVLLLSKKR